jgi:Flp pilus assembly protein TadD
MRTLSGAAGLLLAIVVSFAPLAAHAQDADVVARIQRHGRVPRALARDIARRVHQRLIDNGRQGGDRYDPLRQLLGRALFGGPGNTRAEYDMRLSQVVDQMSRGLTDRTLDAFFGGGDGTALQCAELFSMAMGECDALIAAAARADADLPYIPPDDGSSLLSELQSAGVERGTAREIVRAIGATMLAVPSGLDRSPRGLRLALLMGECPGGLPDRESQVRAWHLGPTSELARCLGVALGRDGARAPEMVRMSLGMNADAAVPFLRWSHDQPVREPQVARGPSRDDLMAEATAHYRANRFADAARSYQRAVTLDPAFMPAQQGLAVSRMRAGDPRGAAEAYRAAARLDPRSAPIQVGLARALAQAGDREGAIAAYRAALAIEPGRADASRELAQLAPPAPQIARGPSPEQIRGQARAHFGARRYAQSEAAYRQLAQILPNDAGAHAGLAASLLALGRPAESVLSYRRATEIDPNNAGFWAALGSAHERANDAQNARVAYQRAIAIDRSHRGANEALARLAPPANVPPPQPPPQPTGPTVFSSSIQGQQPNGVALAETPTRDDIRRVLAPYEERLETCAPTVDTTVTFRIAIRGNDGRVAEVETTGALAGTDEAACFELHLSGARFVRFTRPQFEVRYPFQLRGAR